MPDTFYALTPGEFYDLIEGYRLRRQIKPRREISEAELAKDRAYFIAMDRRQRGGETD